MVGRNLGNARVARLVEVPVAQAVGVPLFAGKEARPITNCRKERVLREHMIVDECKVDDRIRQTVPEPAIGDGSRKVPPRRGLTSLLAEIDRLGSDQKDDEVKVVAVGQSLHLIDGKTDLAHTPGIAVFFVLLG